MVKQDNITLPIYSITIQENQQLLHYYDDDVKNDLSGQQLGNYRLIRLLGQGGFASVYLGQHQYLERPAAIKVLHTTLAEQEKAHFLAEAKLLANLSHPHIVRVLEFAISPKKTFIQNSVVIKNVPYLVMDYVAGGNLRTIYPKGTRLFLDIIITYILQIAEALQYAHDQHIIHRDIKPENLLLNERQEMMISDFGLALFTPQSGLLSRQGMAGTLPYTAPEQLRGKPVFASDQYSLAIVAYEWLCGHPPFRGGDAELIMKHVSAPPPPLTTQNVSIPPATEQVLMKALAKEAAQRYPTIQAFAQALHDSYEQHFYATAPQPVPTAMPQEAANNFPFFYYLSQKASPTMASKSALATQTQPFPQTNTPKSASANQRNRLRMLHKVRIFWINEVLEPSLPEGNFIAPTLHSQQDAVATPLLIPSYQHAPQTLPHNLSIIDTYDQANGELLILGEAGSGKTTLLLQLARQLIERAEQDESFPLPVVFPLSSWTDKQLPLEQWLIDELNNKYQVPRPLAAQWIQTEMLLPLLDGLDEVAESARSACISTINIYKQQHGLTPLVVCSRLNEYLLFPPRVLLERAIVIQPLSRQQINDYFLHSDGNLAGIYQMLHTDPLLYELITTPLMLHIITLAYKDTSSRELFAMHSPEERYQRILNTYVKQMLRQHPPTRLDKPQELINNLTHLARKMQQNGLTVFYIEQLQPKWIDKSKWMQVYLWLAVLLPGAFIGALNGLIINIILFHTGGTSSFIMDAVYGCIIGYLFSNRPANIPTSEKIPLAPAQSKKSPSKGATLQAAIFVAVVAFLCITHTNGLAAGLANGLMLGLVTIPLYVLIHKKSTGISTTSPAPHTQRLANFNKILPFVKQFLNCIPVGIACGLTSIITLLVNHSIPTQSLVFLVTLGLHETLRNTFLAILLSLALLNNTGTIHCIEVVSWSWKRFRRTLKGKSIFSNILLGLGIGIIFGSQQLLQGNFYSTIGSGLNAGVLIATALCVFSGLFEGISNNKLNNNYRTVPNEGIKRSLSHGAGSFILNTLILSLLTPLIVLVADIIINGPLVLANKVQLLNYLYTGFMNNIWLAPLGGLLNSFSFGWLAVLQHSILRLILRLSDDFPLKLSHFLNDATDSALLRKTGGGYIFIHRSFLEYFASLAEAPEACQEQPRANTEPLVRVLNKLS